MAHFLTLDIDLDNKCGVILHKMICARLDNLYLYNKFSLKLTQSPIYKLAQEIKSRSATHHDKIVNIRK